MSSKGQTKTAALRALARVKGGAGVAALSRSEVAAIVEVATELLEKELAKSAKSAKPAKGDDDEKVALASVTG